MKSRLIPALFAAASLVAIAACGGHGGSSLPATGSGSGATGSYTSDAGFDWAKPMLDGSTYIGPSTGAHMQVNVLVKEQNAGGLVQYAQMVNDPASPLYRHFLTPQEIGTRFGASQKDYQTAANYFVSKGLAVAGWPQHIGLSVAGSQVAMERAFGTKFGTFGKDGYTFLAPLSTPRFSATVPVTAVTNLVAMNTKHRYFVEGPPRANSSDNIGYSPQQIREAFDFTGAATAGYDGNGVTIAVVGTGPINVGNRSNLCADQDLAALKTLYGISTTGQDCETDVTPSGVAAGLVVSNIPTASPTWSPSPNGQPSPNPGVPSYGMFPYSGAFQTPPPVSQTTCSGSLPSCNPEDVEAQLDLQQSSLLAPGANVRFYLAYNAGDCFVYFPDSCATGTGSNTAAPQIGLVEADAEIQQIIADNVADVVTLSYGSGETQQVGFGFGSGQNPTAGFEVQEFAAMASEGMAVFASSGDTGVTECLSSSGTLSYITSPCVSYPSGDPNVTSVGGVNAPIDAFGHISGNITAWGTTNGGLSQSEHQYASGSGGGTSTIFSAPAWQRSAINASMREQPDVSLLADQMQGVTIETNGSCDPSSNACPDGPWGIGGTSVAAPEMAAVWAVVLSACKTSASCMSGGPSGHAWRLGNASPYFYSIYKGSNAGGTPRGSFTPFDTYVNTFYDVVYGNNTMPGSETPSPSVTPIAGANAGPGYDEVTGLGVPFVRHLVKAVTNQ